MKKLVVLIVSLLVGCSLAAQELKFNIYVDSEQIKSTGTGSYVGKEFFRDMQQQMMTFVNNTKWTKIPFRPEERVSCNLYITIRRTFSKFVQRHRSVPSF